ncbi:MAG TPA: sodium/proton-translocating pyrophosphatase, partial [Anaeromyxobacteraceae bacterium]
MNLTTLLSAVALASPKGGGEASLVLPDLGTVTFMGVKGNSLLSVGILVSIAGLVFGLVQSAHLKKLPVHRAMLEISELIYETCKTYLKTQGKFIALLWAFIALIIVGYYGFLVHAADGTRGLGVG